MLSMCAQIPWICLEKSLLQRCAKCHFRFGFMTFPVAIICTLRPGKPFLFYNLHCLPRKGKRISCFQKPCHKMQTISVRGSARCWLNVTKNFTKLSDFLITISPVSESKQKLGRIFFQLFWQLAICLNKFTLLEIKFLITLCRSLFT